MEMIKHLAGLALLAVVLMGCGNAEDSSVVSASLQALRQLPGQVLRPRGAAPDPAAVAQLRAALQADGKPVVSVALPDARYAALMVPYYPSRVGQVWSSMTYETVTLVDGILVQSRGFGPDIMASAAPSAAEVSAASGSFHRVYEYIDGADTATRLDYDCDFAPGGAEQVVVLGQAYDTRRVTETCFKGADRFTNVYWFDKGGKIRQSDQRLAPGIAAMRLQRVMD